MVKAIFVAKQWITDDNIVGERGDFRRNFYAETSVFQRTAINVLRRR